MMKMLVILLINYYRYAAKVMPRRRLDLHD